MARELGEMLEENGVIKAKERKSNKDPQIINKNPNERNFRN